MGRIELRRQVEAIRSAVSKRRRDEVYGTVAYRCHACSAVVRVGLARGVADPDDRRSSSDVMDIQTLLDCSMSDCDGIMVKQSGTFSIDCTGYGYYLRIPSRRAAKRMIEAGEIEPQIATV